MNHNNVSIIEEEDDDHIDISMERDISYYSTPLRETPATMFHTFVAKWLVRREGGCSQLQAGSRATLEKREKKEGARSCES